MKPKEIVVGARVKCVWVGFAGKCFGKLGTIHTITRDDKRPLTTYTMKFDEVITGLDSFSSDNVNHFELLVNARYTIKAIFPDAIWCTNPTTRGHEAWIDTMGTYYKEANHRARYDDINHAHRDVARYVSSGALSYPQYVVEETD